MSSLKMKHISIRVSGRVQGVFYRAMAKQKADELHLHGSVGNNEDGSVTLEAEGDESSLQEFIAWCAKGPKLSRVDHCEIKESAMQDLREFFIRR